jgi:Predicted permeases
MVTLAVPMSVLVATLMAFGSLSSSNEITIMKAGGISLPKLMFPVLIFSVIITYLMVLFNNDVLPEANHRARILLGDISRTKPSFFLESGKFSEDINGARILVKKTFENSNNLEGIYIYDYTNPHYKNLITAEKGDIGFTSDFKSVVMNLFNGEIHQFNGDNPANKYRKIKYERHRIIFSAEGFGFQRSGENTFVRGDRELSASAMKKIVDSLVVDKLRGVNNFVTIIKNDIKQLKEINFRDTVFSRTPAPFGESPEKLKKDSLTASEKAASEMFRIYQSVLSKNLSYKSQFSMTDQYEKQEDVYEVEIYKKYSIPFACIVFTLIGAPLGYRVKRGGIGIAAGLSLLFFLVYWAALIGGEKLADRAILSPFLGMWLVNIILGIFGLYLMFKSS